MPIYAYRCTKCGAEEEHIQKFSDPPMERCEACGGKLEKLLSPAAFHLKGGGWYKDGYASQPAGTGDGGDSKDKGKSSDKASKDGGDKAKASKDTGGKNGGKKSGGSGKAASE